MTEQENVVEATESEAPQLSLKDKVICRLKTKTKPQLKLNLTGPSGPTPFYYGVYYGSQRNLSPY